MCSPIGYTYLTRCVLNGRSGVQFPSPTTYMVFTPYLFHMFSAADWRYAAEQFVKKLPDKVFVHRSECNYSKKTFDGVDMMGERLADEVFWYAIGRLYESVSNAKDPGNVYTNHSDQPAKLPNKSKIAGLEPINFITVASPHLGSRGHRQLPLLCGLPFLERSASQTAHWLVGRTGKHLFLTDHDDGKPPLLLRMATDSEDLRFISALQAFKRRVAYANVNYDHVVGWSTSSIRRCNELPKSNLLFLDEKYPHVAYVEGETSKVIQVKTPSTKTDQTTELEEEMIRGLTQVHWDRVDVSFHKSRQRIVAHNTIQVKTFWLNSDGVDVPSVEYRIMKCRDSEMYCLEILKVLYPILVQFQLRMAAANHKLEITGRSNRESGSAQEQNSLDSLK
ncbi:hypothetical protein QQ045_022695 [Rhodiola kirilowii]